LNLFFIFDRKQNNEKVNGRVKKLNVDLMTDDEEKSKKYKNAYNMNFQKTKEKGKY